uniref:Uncharacterized protein n=1 Tax=Capra hircus TaxID=9925 RepID=A0A8C2NN65_CAPHI
MYLQDTTRLSKEERQKGTNIFQDQNSRRDQKGGFQSNFHNLFAKNTGEKGTQDFLRHYRKTHSSGGKEHV